MQLNRHCMQLNGHCMQETELLVLSLLPEGEGKDTPILNWVVVEPYQGLKGGGGGRGGSEVLNTMGPFHPTKAPWVLNTMGSES